MNSKTALIRFGMVIAFLLPVRTVRAGDAVESSPGGEVRVDVVVDMTDKGRKITHPTPDEPAYYLPISVGYKQFGYTHYFQRPPPNEWDVEHALAIALYNQGYRLMTKEGHPSLVLVFWWGYISPADMDIVGNTGKTGVFSGYGREGLEPSATQGSGIKGGGSPPTGTSLGSNPGLSPFYYPPGEPQNGGNATIFSPFAFSTGAENFNEDIMQGLVAGDSVDDHQKYPDPRLDEIGPMTTQPRYFVMVSALDFNDWLHHKATLLWKAHVSTELWGHYLDQVIGTMINAAAAEFGRETKAPHFYGVPIMPLGRIVVGVPEVTDFKSQGK